uniref:Uncharacterized protein n=1 Tax=Nothobranchius furzeri TaxID=105023 RepID=A0A1A8TXG2_NOTFU|nr:uncharacterized protein LOC129157223 [Nothobranchius furzeri]XP_054592494.1 uncharacterized protein LOC129157223 [Nothobranchius furzeri]
MTRPKPGKRWRRTSNEDGSNKRPRRISQLSSLFAATNVHVETDEQYLSREAQQKGLPPGGDQNTTLEKEPIQPPDIHAGCAPLSELSSLSPIASTKRGTRDCFNY